MEASVQEKVQKVLLGELKYSSSNFAFNILISKLQKKLQADPGCMDACMKDMEEFLAKYPIVAKVDLMNIAVL